MVKRERWSEQVHESASSLAPLGTVPLASWPIEEDGRAYVESVFLDERRRVLLFISGPDGWGSWGHGCSFGERTVEAFLQTPGGVPRAAVAHLKRRLAGL